MVRYDQRDTGLLGPGGGRYTLEHLTDDADAVIAATGACPVHLVGVSMANTLVTWRIVAATWWHRSPSPPWSPDPEAGMERTSCRAEVDPVDGMLRAMATTEASDRPGWRRSSHAAERAEPRPDAVAIHQDAAFRGSLPSVDWSGSIEVSALVVHGDLDRVLPLRHAESLAAGIADRRIGRRSRHGHLPQPSVWDERNDRTLAHVLNADILKPTSPSERVGYHAIVAVPTNERPEFAMVSDPSVSMMVSTPPQGRCRLGQRALPCRSAPTRGAP